MPKAVLHDHLDGGLRPATISELAAEAGYGGLPTAEPERLRAWFNQSRSGTLEKYLQAFDHTVAVMQTPHAVERVAYEAVVDLAADGVVYAELRFGPSLLTARGMSRQEAIEAALRGVETAERETGTVARIIVTAMRQSDDSEEVARVAVKFVGRGVVAFDLAGPEAGNPPQLHAPACHIARSGGLGLTIHAGEAAGPQSMWEAYVLCGAQRLGHGVRIVDGTRYERGQILELGGFARTVRDHRVPLETAPTSNAHTGAVRNLAEHPLGALHRAGFAVTINTDNRLMSDTTMSAEYAAGMAYGGLTWADLGEITETALRAGFADWPTRERLIRDLVRPAYAALEV